MEYLKEDCLENKPKIAVIGLKGLPAFGGAATVGESIIEQLKDKYDFTVYSISSHTDLKTGNYKGYRQIVLKSFFIKKFNVIYYYFMTSFLVLFKNYDLIHLHHRDAAFILIILRLRFKVVLTTHGVQLNEISKWEKLSWFFNAQLKYFIKYANEITCVSRSDQRILKTTYLIESSYIPNGIMLNEKIITPKYTGYIFFSAGRVIHSKGCHILLEALKKINYDKKIIIAGSLEHEPDYTISLRNLYKDINVEFVGLVKDKVKLFGYLKSASFFVFPSFNESMSMMLLEAISVKTPVISSDIRANTDIFNNNEILFFKNKSIKDLSEKIVWALNHKIDMRLMAENAYKRAKEEYNWSSIADKYSTIYNRQIAL